MSQTTHDKLGVDNFKDAYQILKNNADKLEQADQIDIDNLVSIVEESLAAYRVCQSRIEAVEAALQSAFANAGAESLIDGDDEA